MDELLVERYERKRLLGRGAMGDVWLAFDTRLGRHVAIKELRRALEMDARGIDRLMREARLAANLHHSRVVSVYDLIIVEGQPVVVMEYVEGESLAARLRRTGNTDVPTALGIGRDVALALTVAHGAGIVHRDVKPANVLIDSAGRAKLADFGIARGTDDSMLTGTGQMLGTVAFMAPETALGNPPGPAADIYSLGATLYAAVEGRAPFHARDGQQNTASMLLRMIREDAPPATSAGVLTPLLAQMMAREVTDRPTAQAVLESLTALRTDPHGIPHGEVARPADRSNRAAASRAPEPSKPRGEDPPGPSTEPDMSGEGGASGRLAGDHHEADPVMSALRQGAAGADVSRADEPDDVGTLHSSPTVLRSTGREPFSAAADPAAPAASSAAATTPTRPPKRRWRAVAVLAAVLLAAGGATYTVTRVVSSSNRPVLPSPGTQIRATGTEALRLLTVTPTDNGLEVIVELDRKRSAEVWVDLRFTTSPTQCPDVVVVFAPATPQSAQIGPATCDGNDTVTSMRYAAPAAVSADTRFSTTVGWSAIGTGPVTSITARAHLVVSGVNVEWVPANQYYAIMK